MNPKIERLFKAIENQRDFLHGSALALGDAQLDWTPGDDIWSVGQIIQHLVLSDETLGQAQDPAAAPREAAMFRVLPRPWRRALVLGALRRDTALPLPSPAVEPRGAVPLAQLLARWEAARAEIRRALGAMTATDRRYFHPVLGPLTAAQMLELNHTHTAYHTRQIEALQRDPFFPHGATS